MLVNKVVPSKNALNVDKIPNGWIEVIETDTTQNNSFRDTIRFKAICNRHYFLNSNSSEVFLIKRHIHNNWLPLNDFTIPGLPLCSRKCLFQSNLSNGYIQIDAAPRTTWQSSNLIQAFESSLIKFKCFKGYSLRSILYKAAVNETSLSWDKASEVVRMEYQGKSVIDKCGRNGVETLLSAKEKYDGIYHQCYKHCSLYKQNITGMNGFIVPVRHIYSPGDHVKFLCNEGYVSQLPVLVENKVEMKLKNTYTFECSINGSWYLINPQDDDGTNQFSEHGYSNAELKKLAMCSKVETFLVKKDDDGEFWTSDSLSYKQLNIRTFSLLVVVGGCVISMLVISLLTMRFYQKKQHNLGFREIFSPQLDPLLFSNDNSNFSSNTADFRTLPQNTVQRSQTQQQDCVSTVAAASLAFGSIGSSSDLNRCNNIPNTNNSYLPSYEEAMSQPPPPPQIQPPPNTLTPFQQPSIQPAPIEARSSPLPNQTTESNNSQPMTSSTASANGKEPSQINETTSIIEIAPSTLQSLGITTQHGRSRSGSIRSNFTIRSANGSIRTTNSIGTSNSIGNTSYNLPPPSSSHRKNNMRARRHQNFKSLSSQNRASARGNSNMTVSTQNSNQDSSSCTTDTNTVLTTTTCSSIMSNETNASRVALRGSLSNFEVESNDVSIDS